MVSHSRPSLDKEELEKIIDVYHSGSIAVGCEIEEFEDAIAKYVGKKYAVAVSNGTTALHLLLHSMGIKEGDEVILPASVCPGVMHSIEYTKARPIISDINKDNFNISVEYTKKLITKKTKAIIVPHMFGLPSDIDDLLNLNIPIIEDCAQSIGAKYRENQIGSFGYASIFSFYATKMMTSIDGGMILTDDKELSDTMRDLRYYGGKRDYKIRFNYKMQNINAVVGLEQLKKLDSFIEERIELCKLYKTNFKQIPWIAILNIEDKEKKSSHYRFIIKVVDDKVEFFKNLCKIHNIVLGDTIFENLSTFAPQFAKDVLINTQNLMQNTFSFPLYPGIDKNEINKFFRELLQ